MRETDAVENSFGGILISLVSFVPRLMVIGCSNTSISFSIRHYLHWHSYEKRTVMQSTFSIKVADRTHQAVVEVGCGRSIPKETFFTGV